MTGRGAFCNSNFAILANISAPPQMPEKPGPPIETVIEELCHHLPDFAGRVGATCGSNIAPITTSKCIGYISGDEPRLAFNIRDADIV